MAKLVGGMLLAVTLVVALPFAVLWGTSKCCALDVFGPAPSGLRFEATTAGAGLVRVSGAADLPDGSRVCWWPYAPYTVWGPPAGCPNALPVSGGRFSGVGDLPVGLTEISMWVENGPERNARASIVVVR